MMIPAHAALKGERLSKLSSVLKEVLLARLEKRLEFEIKCDVDGPQRVAVFAALLASLGMTLMTSERMHSRVHMCMCILLQLRSGFTYLTPSTVALSARGVCMGSPT